MFADPEATLEIGEPITGWKILEIDMIKKVLPLSLLRDCCIELDINFVQSV